MLASYYRLNTQRVRELMKNQELKRWWVAEAAGVHRTTLRRWLSGRIDKVRTENIVELARVLSTEPQELVARPSGR